MARPPRPESTPAASDRNSERGSQGDSEPKERPKDADGKTRYSSLYDLLDDDPDLDEPFWPPILFGLGLAFVLALAVLWRHCS